MNPYRASAQPVRYSPPSFSVRGWLRRARRKLWIWLRASRWTRCDTRDCGGRRVLKRNATNYGFGDTICHACEARGWVMR